MDQLTEFKYKYFFRPMDDFKLRARDKYTVIPEVRSITYLTGKDAGSDADLQLKANQSVLICFGSIKGNQRHLLVMINPELLGSCHVNFNPTILADFEGAVCVQLTTLKAIDLSQLSWIIRMGVIP